MVKKVLTLALGLVLSVGAMAQWGNPTVSQNDIQFWTGTGSNRAVIAITWNDATAGNIGIAWGVQWNGGNMLLANLMDTIAAYDSRLSVTWNSSHSYINNLGYTDTELGLNISGVVEDMTGVAWWMYNWKDSADVDKSNSSVGVAGDAIVNGDFVDWLPMDPDTYESYPADTMLMATNPNPDPLSEEATIAASDILYWVGTGSNEVVLAVNWADTALAWGYRFNGSKTVSDMMSDIQAADPRFSYELDSYGYLSDIAFAVAPGDTLRKQNAYTYWESKNNGVTDMGMGQTLTNGNFEKWAEPAAGIVVDSFSYEYDGVTYWSYIYVYPMTINPVSVPAPVYEEATIATSDILYWVGTGSNEVVLAVNWADTALAWGYRFNGSKTVSDMMSDIQAADPRFSYELDSYGYLSDIAFAVAPGDTLRKQNAYTYWESKNNGVTDMGMGQTLTNGNFEKWAEPAAGIVVDSFSYEYDGVTYWSYIYVYTMEIHPVSVPQTEGVINAESVSLSVYPNPVADMVTLSGIIANTTATLYDMRGSVVATFAVNGNETRLDLSHLTSGVYLLRVADSVVKIVKE